MLALLLMTERPKLIQADQGTEFFNKNVAKMLQAFGPKLYHTFSDKKSLNRGTRSKNSSYEDGSNVYRKWE